MSKNPSFRDLKNLSAYLDGELSKSSSRKMESRLARDPDLRAALDDLRVTKNILQRTPKRRAPRHFTLSPQMVAKRPPMPRLVPALNYASVLALFLLFFSFISPIEFGSVAMDSAPMMMEAPVEELAEAPAMEASAAEEAPAPAIAESAPAEEETEAGDVANGTELASTPRTADDAAEKAAAEEEAILPTLPSNATLVAAPYAEERQETSSAFFFTTWQKILFAAIILFPILAYILRRLVIAKWQRKN